MSRVLVHTIDQPGVDITAIVLSCHRPALLEETLSSFLKTAWESTRVVICDDSGEQSFFEELVGRYGHFADVVMFPQNRGQWHAFDFLVSYATTKYLLYIEDDWRFLRGGYLEASRNILEKYPHVGTVDVGDIRPPDSIGERTEHFISKKLWRLGENYHFWCGWTGSPSLRRRDDLLHLGRTAVLGPEWIIDRKFYMMGLRSVYLWDVYVTHIGWDLSRAEGRRASDLVTPCDLCSLKNRCDLPKTDWNSVDMKELGLGPVHHL